MVVLNERPLEQTEELRVVTVSHWVSYWERKEISIFLLEL